MADAARLVADSVRSSDHDRYLSALYAPADKREALLALYAFNAEIAAVRDRIREPLPGEVRMQWWRDVIAGHVVGEASGHPVADALVSAIDRYGLPKKAFDNYIEARIFDLYDDPMPSRTDLEGYCGETAGAIIQLAAMVLDPAAAPNHADLAGHAGCAQAITGLLRSLPLHRARGQCFMPRDILAAAGMTPEEFVPAEARQAAGRAIDAMISLAREHFQEFRKEAASLPQNLRPAFLPIALVPAYLTAIASKGPKTMTEPTNVPAWKRQWAMLRAASRGW